MVSLVLVRGADVVVVVVVVDLVLGTDRGEDGDGSGLRVLLTGRVVAVAK